MTPDLFDSPSVVAKDCHLCVPTATWKPAMVDPNDLLPAPRGPRNHGRPVRGNKIRCKAAVTFLYFFILHLSGGDYGAKEKKEP